MVKHWTDKSKGMNNLADRIAGLSPAKRALIELRLKKKRLVVSGEQRIPQREKRSSAPLSFAQQRLWFLDLLEPGRIAYNIPAAFRLFGPINVKALELSLNEILRRHEVLRTTFTTADDQPVQVISSSLTLTVQVVDLRDLLATERESEVQRLATEEAQRPFDLSQGPLLRATLLKLNEEDHVLLLTIHHIVSDGWSMGLLFRELSILYEAFSAGKPSPLAELAIQYADFAVWQQQWLQGDVLETQLAYWKDKLGGELPILELPTDRPRPAVQTHRGAIESLALSKELTDALQAMSRREGATLFMTLLAAFKTLLYRLTEQKDTIVGAPIANRNRTEIEGLIGFFVNTLVMRTDLSGQPTFRELLGRVRETALGAYAHQDMPFERLVEELHPERDMSHTPLFQVMFNMTNVRDIAFELHNLSAERVSSVEPESKFDLTLFMRERDQGLSGSVEYNTDLFDAERIERMVGHFQTLLEGIVADPEKCISDLPILDEAERRQLLVAWNDTAVEFPRDKCIHELFEKQVERTPDAAAVIFGKQRLTYRELNTRANQLAHYLHSQGVVAESRVGIWMERSLDMMVALLGTLKAAGAYVPLDPSYPQERLAFMLSDSQVSVLLTMEKFLEDYPAYAGHVVCLDRDFEAIAGGSEENPISDITPDSAAYVIYTSGSTGTPKGVIGLHRGAVNRLSWMWRVYPFKDGEVCCQKTYLSFVDSVWEIFGPLLKGVPTVIIPEEVVKDPHLLVDNLAAAHVSRILLVPSLLGVLLDSFGDLQKRLLDLKTWVSSGEEISVELARRFGQVMPEAKLINLYGSSEVSADVTCYEVADGRQHRCIPIGRPIDNTSIYILDSHQQPVPIGVSGELYIGGVGMARGYLNQPDLTAERFIPSLFGQEEVLFKTGDLGRYLPDGNIEYLGRRDHQVKVRGFRIELGEIESQIKGLEAVSNSVVVLREDRPADQRLTAYYVCKDGQAVSESEVRRQLQAQLPEYMVPQHFVELESIPLTPNGKVDRKALPKPDTDGASEQGYVAPRTEAEQKIAAVWQEVLNSERVGVNENFFKLGGHSLLATQVMSRINRLFNIQLPLRRLFEARTVGALAEYINSEKYHVEENPVSRISREGELSVSFSQERLWFLTQLEPGDTAYHISAGIRLEGQLRVDNLEQSLTEIVGRHEALRTTFEEIEGQPVQVISPPAAFDLPVLDLEALPEADRAARLQQIIADETRRPFDLSAGLLFRAVLVRLGQQEYVLVLVMHHIITDGWSLGVFTRELESLYSAFCEGRPSPLAELAVQYADYAAWQRERLQGEVLDTQVKYWKQKLGEELPILQLSTDRPRPAIQTHHGARHGFDLPEGLSERIEDLSRQQGVTLYMMLLAAFKVLLYRYTGQADFGVGSPIANRTQPELEGLIGFFVNTLVLRTDMSGDPGFIELLSRVRETTLGAFDHQELPFEKLVEVVNPAREMSYSPLFQVMFVLQNMPGAAVQLPGLKLSSVAVDSGSAMFDLTLFMWERNQGLSGSVEYNTDLFDAERIERMVGHFSTLLDSIVADPGKCLSELALLPQAERQQLLVGWNDTVMDYPKDKCIHELFEHQVNQTPDAIAVACKNEQITYDELNIRANQLAHFLNELGVGPQVVVGLCAKRSVELVIGLVGILKAGGIYLPLDSEYPEERLLFMLEDSRAQIVLTDKNAESVLSKSNAPIVCLESNDENLARHSTEDPISCVKVDTPAYLIYTSGSTGNPKGVLGLQRGLLNRFNWMWQAYPFEAGDVCCQKTSISFVDSIWEILGPLLKGIKTVIISDGVVKEPRLLIKYSADEQVTRITMVPSYLRVMLDTYSDLQGRLPKLKLWISSGEALSKELSQRFREKLPQSLLLNLYGSSEVSADVTWYDTNSTNHESPSVPIGHPIANTQVYILDSYLQPVPIGVPGELYIGGDNLAAGYLNLGKITDNAFIPNPFSDKPDSRLFKSGDIGCWLADGNIELIGRADHQVKIRGFRIEPGEVEAVLNKHPDVKESIVLAPEDRPNDKRLVAYVILKQTQVTASQELHRFVKQRLPAYMVPSAIVFLNALPLTPSGKVDRRALPAPDRTRSLPVETLVAPRDELELQLTKTWEKVLGVQPVGVSDNFFELGGHSLLAVRLMTQIEKIHGENLPLATLFQAPTVEQLADILREQGWSAPSSSLEAIEIGGAGSISIGHKIARHIPAKSHPYLKQQYLKVKQHPGYRYLKRQHYKAKSSFTKRFLSYSPAGLEEKLRAIGLAEADTVYMHSAFKAFNGFSGGPHQIVDSILNVIGDSGNLLMVSMAYTGSTEEYLKDNKSFDVTKTESSMGIITEIFRRKKDVVRSLNPAHPILAFGPDAKWIISDHEKTLYSCGKGSPFEKILKLNAKALFFDVPFGMMTFFHYLEDKFKDSSPVELYADEPVKSTVIDSKGNEIRVKTYVFSQEARERRSARHIEGELRKKNLLKTDTIGNTKLILVNLGDVLGCAQALVNTGIHFYN